MVTFDEELEAAKQAQTVISTLSISSAPDPNIVAALRNAYDVARRKQSSPFQTRRFSMTHEIKSHMRCPI